jgi:hypothetical protein
MASDDGRRLYLIKITLKEQGAASDSLIDSGETTAFYVESGTIKFTVATGSVRYQSGDGVLQASDGDAFSLAAGQAAFVDSQSTEVSLAYQNEGRTPADLIIAAAPPLCANGGTPTAG